MEMLDKDVLTVDVGGRLRQLRTERNRSMRSLARSSGLSTNALSMIERGRTSPSVSTHYKLAEALEVPITAFFRLEPPKQDIVFRASGERKRVPIPNGQWMGLGGEAFTGRMEPFMLSLEPGASSGPFGMLHSGGEFALCLSGQIEYEVEGQRFILKPGDRVVGFYYFQSSESLLSAIEAQMQRDPQLKGEFFLADAVNIMLERGLKMRTEKVNVWLDAGTPESLLETNRYLLDNGRNNSEEASKRETAVIIPPVYVHPTAVIENSIIGPFVSIGAGAFIRSSIVRDSILEDEAQVTDVILEDSLIGRQAQIQRRAGVINSGDHTVVVL